MSNGYHTLSSWPLVAFGLLSCSLACANPSDPIVMSGAVSFENADTLLSITASDQAIINWGEFSIAEGELTQFFQPTSQSVVVNRVTSDLSSVLLGSLKANGKIFLLNPNGILIGENASIDTSGFIASTLSANLQDILADHQEVLFQGSSTATITNLGSITAWDGDVYLIGYQVDNKGTIDAPSGTVAIGAGQEVLLKPTALEKIVIRPSLKKYEDSSPIIDNSGTIAACRAELKTDGNPYAMAINHTGSIDAIGIQELNGEVYLVSLSGNNGVYGAITARNSDGTGGSVRILGDHIALLDNAIVDASGAMGGGKVLIGGDLSGGNPSIMNAKTTFVDQNALVRADALVDGNGGKVIAWADETTCFYGNISARGGENSGDGGFVEVSGKMSLDFNGYADRLAPHGKAGTLLLDPSALDITVSTAADSNVTGASPFMPTAGGANLQVSTLITALGSGPVTVECAASGGGSTGNLTISSPINYTSNNDLTFTTNIVGVTQGDITVTANVTNQGSGSITFDSSNNLYIEGATITIFAAPGVVSFSAQRGDVVFSTATNPVTVLPYSTIYAYNNVEITASNNAINFFLTPVASTITAANGNLIVQGGSASGAAAEIQGSPLTINVPNGHIEVTGGTVAGTSAEIIGSGPGMTLNCGGHMYITSGNQSSSTLASVRNVSGTFNVNMTGIVGPNPGQISVTSTTGPGFGTAAELYCYDDLIITTPTDVFVTGPVAATGEALIWTEKGQINITADRVVMNGNNSAFTTYILTELGNLTIRTGHDFSMNNGCLVEINNFGMPTPPLDILIIANTNITVGSGAYIQNWVTGGAVTLVVDNFYPVQPMLGPGAFINHGRILTANGPLWIFTSRRPQNTQTGSLNGGPFIPGPIYVDSTSERWYTWYNNTSNGTPWKVFYKDLPTPTPIQMQTAVTNFNAAAFEFLQDIENYDVFWYWKTHFSSQYDAKEYNKFHHHEGMTSSDVFGKKLFHLLRKSYKEQNGKIINLIK